MPAKDRTLAVDLGGVTLPTPAMIAAGCAGGGRELAGLVDLHRVGGLVSRTITVHPRPGASTPRIAESPSGVVWNTGLQNAGIDAFVADELPRLARAGAPTFVSIGGGTLEEYVRLTSALQARPEVAAIEVYLSGRDETMDHEILGAHVERLVEIVGAVARTSLVPVFAKLPGGVADVVTLARSAVRAGATGLTLSGSPPALAVELGTLRPALGDVTGWLSGPALKPLTLRTIFEVSVAMPHVPLIASGGIRTGSDAVECLLAGAWAVQIGTGSLVDPAAPVEVARGIAASLKALGLRAPGDLRGRLRLPAVPDRAAGA
ncbi:MAG TPA: dihydroorotate dehydrogenase [Actinomycetota bacterium]|nr:dihydroorotate dehydrogenase [Actinomycetota bacterium]